MAFEVQALALVFRLLHVRKRGEKKRLEVVTVLCWSDSPVQNSTLSILRTAFCPQCIGRVSTLFFTLLDCRIPFKLVPPFTKHELQVLFSIVQSSEAYQTHPKITLSFQCLVHTNVISPSLAIWAL